MAETYVCPACGYPLLREPPRPRGGGGSYEICFSCGFEYGVTDEDKGYTYTSWRERWIALGMPWHAGIKAPPPGWNPQQQLQTLFNDHTGTSGQ